MKWPWDKKKAPKPKMVEPVDDEHHAQQAASFMMQPFWAEMLVKMADMRSGALGTLRNRKPTDLEELQSLERWRSIEEVTSLLERYPESVVENHEEKRKWQTQRQ